MPFPICDMNAFIFIPRPKRFGHGVALSALLKIRFCPGGYRAPQAKNLARKKEVHLYCSVCHWRHLYKLPCGVAGPFVQAVEGGGRGGMLQTKTMPPAKKALFSGRVS